ncbi:MAG TPA: hypothetical protein ENI37_03515 [Chloroflexi bacterium]|nr:hypothetical protein [Chloroflexota bacterium]
MFQAICLIGVGFGLAATSFCILLALIARSDSDGGCSGSNRGAVWVFLIGGVFCCALVGVLLAIGRA